MCMPSNGSNHDTVLYPLHIMIIFARVRITPAKPHTESLEIIEDYWYKYVCLWRKILFKKAK